MVYLEMKIGREKKKKTKRQTGSDRVKKNNSTAYL